MFKNFLIFFSLIFILSCAKQTDSQNKTIVCFGDSLTQGTGATDNKNYPYFLQQMLKVPIVNLGVRGNTATEGLDRIDSVINIIKKKPSIVIIEFGANDFFRQIPLKQTKEAIDKITDIVLQNGAVPVIVSTQDSQLHDLYIMLQSTAKEKNVLFIDGILNEIWARRELFSDEIHPNSYGYKLVAQKIHDKILPLMNNN